MTRKSRREIERELNEMDTDDDAPDTAVIRHILVDENGDPVETVKEKEVEL